MRHLPILLLVLLAACGRPTPYDEAVSVTQLSLRSFLIEAHGNDSTPRARVSRYALLKATELCARHSFTHFVVRHEKERNIYDGGLSAHETSIRVFLFDMDDRFYDKGEWKSTEVVGTRLPDAHDCAIIAAQLSGLADEGETDRRTLAGLWERALWLWGHVLSLWELMWEHALSLWEFISLQWERVFSGE